MDACHHQPMARITDPHLLHYRELYASGRISFLEIRAQTGIAASTLEQLLAGRARPSVGGPFAQSFAGVDTLFDEEKTRRALWKKRYHREYNRKRREQNLERAFAMMGERKCAHCGSRDNLEFDHINPATKKFAIGNQASTSWRRLVIEVKKCQLLCYGCHKTKSAAESAAWNTGRFAGENSGNAQLTNKQVAQLRQLFRDDPRLTIRKLAKQLDMAEKVVRQILRGETYAQAGGPLVSPEDACNYIAPERKERYRRDVIDLYRQGITRLSDICKQVPVSSHTAKTYLVAEGLLSLAPKPKTNQPHAKLTIEQARETRERFAKGVVTQTELAREFGMSITGMGRLLKGRSYAHAGGPVVSGWLRGQSRHV